VTISSPTCTTSFFETRSSTSESPDCPWTTTPEARVRRSTEETALDSSVSRRTRAAPLVTFVTVPTNPSAVTTAAFRRTPSSDPAVTTISCSNADAGRAITCAATPS
jgi:hypothetical protein